MLLAPVWFITRVFVLFVSDANDQSEPVTMLVEGSVDCLALHKHALYAAGRDGVLRKVHVTQSAVQVLEQVTLGIPVASMGFNTAFTRLALGSENVSISPPSLYISYSYSQYSLPLFLTLLWRHCNAGVFRGPCTSLSLLIWLKIFNPRTTPMQKYLLFRDKKIMKLSLQKNNRYYWTPHTFTLSFF